MNCMYIKEETYYFNTYIHIAVSSIHNDDAIYEFISFSSVELPVTFLKLKFSTEEMKKKSVQI